MAYVDALARLIDAKTLPQLLRTMGESNGRAMSGIAWALSTSRNYPASALLEALNKADMPKSAIVEVIAAQKTRFSVRELLNAAYSQDASERSGLFKIIAELADESSLDDLIARIEGKDPVARLHIINVLAEFNIPKVQQAMQHQLKDNSKFIRSAALSALWRAWTGRSTCRCSAACCGIRKSRCRTRPSTWWSMPIIRKPIKYLVEVLKDENEYARRAAVEVLNAVGTSKSVKYLLEVIADSDWWVRTRAADALGKIGGPRVVDAVLTLVKDENQDIRRAAIEILNQTKDERAVAQLIEATKDRDWWVSERAVDALAEIGSSKSLPRFMEMLAAGEPKSLPTVIRAIGKIGDQKMHRRCCCPCCSVRRTRSRWRPSRRSPNWPTSVAPIPSACACRRLAAGDGTISQAVARAMQELDNRFSDAADRRQSARREDAGAGQDAAHRQSGICPRSSRRQEVAGEQARHRDSEAGRHHRGPLQVHREDRQGRVRHGAADGRHRRRGAPDPEILEPERRRRTRR